MILDEEPRVFRKKHCVSQTRDKPVTTRAFFTVFRGYNSCIFVEIFFVLIINLGFWSLNSSSCGPAFEDGMGGKKHKNGKPRVSSKNLVFGMNPTFLSCLEAQGIYIYMVCYEVPIESGSVKQSSIWNPFSRNSTSLQRA